MKLVYFHRNYHGLTGGHLKVWDYFNHVDTTEGYRSEIFFTPQSIQAVHNPWFYSHDRILLEWRPHRADIVFLAGLDWLSIGEAESNHFSRPIINLIQHVRHSDPQDARFASLGHRAIRICVSPEVSTALCATGRVNGPIFTIPIALDLSVFPEPVPASLRRYDLVIAGLKRRF